MINAPKDRQEYDGDDLLKGLRNAAWLDQQEFPPLAWHVTSVIPEGMSILAGSPKAGKSWFSLDVALAVASGGRALGRIPVQKRPVLLLALEDGNRRLQERMRRLTHGEALPEGLDYFTQVKQALVVDTIEAWMATLDPDGPPPLVILDTLGRAMPPSKSTDGYASDYAFAAGLKRTVDDWPGAALLAIHHTRKLGAADFLDAVSGTQGIAGAVDSVIVLTRKRNDEEGLLQVTGRDTTEGEYALRFDGQWTLDGDDLVSAAQQVTERQQVKDLGDDSLKILQFVNQHPAGIGPTAVAEALGLEVAKVKVYLGRLVEQERIAKAKRGLYIPVTSVTSLPSDDEKDDEGNKVTEVTPLQVATVLTARCSGCGQKLITRASQESGTCIPCSKKESA